MRKCKIAIKKTDWKIKQTGHIQNWLLLPLSSCWLYFFSIPVFQKMPSSLSVTAQREGLSSPPKPHPPSYPPPSRQSSLNPLPLFTATPSSPWTARACFPLVLICRWAPLRSTVTVAIYLQTNSLFWSQEEKQYPGRPSTPLQPQPNT